MTDIIVSATTSSGITLNTGSQMTVQNGGQALDTIVDAGALLFVSSGGIGTSSTLSGGGETVYVGGSAYSDTVLNSGFLVVDAGGLVSGATVSSGGVISAQGIAATLQAVVLSNSDMYVSRGATASGTIVSHSGYVYVSAGAIISGTQLVSSGFDVVSSGGSAVGTLIGAHSQEVLLSGGSAQNTSVGSGGSDIISSGGLATGAIVSANGAQVVSVGGSAYATTIQSGGLEFVYSGGNVSGATVDTGGSLVVLPGATVLNTTNAGGAVISTGVVEITTAYALQYAQAGAVAGGTVHSTSEQFVLHGGSAVGTTINGGTQSIYNGGVASGVVLVSSATQYIYSQGVASGTTATSASIYVYSGGETLSATLNAGATEYVYSSGSSLDDNVGNNANQIVQSGGSATGAVIGNGGSAQVSSGGSESFATVSSGGFLIVSSGGTASGTLVASGGIEQLLQGAVTSATDLAISGLIDLTFLNSVGTGTATLNSGTDVLTVTQGGSSAQLNLSGSYAGEFFHLTGDGNGGTEVYDDNTPCYCRGTMVLTDQGERRVEDIAIGDRLVTFAGGSRPVRWVGQRSYAGRFIAGNTNVLPILIRAGALCDQVPKRDLLVSPLHALFIDGILIPAQALINGGSIEQLRNVEQLEYFHLELDAHDVILAEGMPAESYLDDRNRNMFQNARDYAALYPGEAPIAASYCAPRLAEGPAVAAIAAKLDARGRVLGHLPAGLITVPLRAGTTHLIVPPGVGRIRLVSPFGQAAGDLRWLGALISAVIIDGESLDLADPCLAQGFHAVEQHEACPVRQHEACPVRQHETCPVRQHETCPVRWTNGDAQIMLNPVSVTRQIRIDAWRDMHAAQPRGLQQIDIVSPGVLRVEVAAGVAQLRLVSPGRLMAGDHRCLGALITAITLAGEPIDLGGDGCGQGFHAAESHGGALVRWTAAEALLAIEPRPVARWCELAIGAVAGVDDRAVRVA